MKDVFRRQIGESGFVALILVTTTGILGTPGIFGLDYYAIAIHNANAFSSHIDRLGAIYYAWGTLTTVGSNIGALSGWARSLTIAQMVIDLAVFGVVIAVIIARVTSSLGGVLPGGGDE